MPESRILSAIAALLVALSAPSTPAQDKVERDPRRIEIDAQLTKDMVAFARSAASQKAYSLAREVARVVLERYDSESPTVRQLLGQRKVRGAWQEQAGAAATEDAIDERRRRSLTDKWQKVCERAGDLHREFALALLAEGKPVTVTRPELELALAYLPGDAECHKALGHHQLDRFWGSAEYVAFAQRMRAIRDKAAEIREHEYRVVELKGTDEPIELRQIGIPTFGARSEHYTYWSSDSFEAAANCAVWAERCHEFLTHLLGPQANLVRADAWRWHAVLRTPEERDLLLQKSPSTRGPFSFDQAQLFVGIGFALAGGGRASATWQGAELDSDYAVANTTKRHFLDQRNEGFGEGLTHVTTWLLCGSTHTYFTDLPKTVAGGAELMPRLPEKWLELLQKEIDEGRDMPLVQVPRERIDNFRDSTRLKSWSFMFWALARYPDRWLPLIDAVSVPGLTEPMVEAAFREVFDMPVGDLEVEWRRWARRGSPLGRVSGWAGDR